MTLRKWARLFMATLLVGAVGSLIAGIVLQLSNGIELKGMVDFLINLVLLLGTGVMVSVYSQMGFFGYLMINYMVGGMFKTRTWEYIQIALTGLVVLELMFFRSFMGGKEAGTSDIVLGIVLIVIALIVAYYKARMTNASAWIPTMFFMVAVTALETIGVLSIGVNQATAFIVVPLVACNAYQILVLHRILPKNG